MDHRNKNTRTPNSIVSEGTQPLLVVSGGAILEAVVGLLLDNVEAQDLRSSSIQHGEGSSPKINQKAPIVIVSLSDLKRYSHPDSVVLYLQEVDKSVPQKSDANVQPFGLHDLHRYFSLSVVSGVAKKRLELRQVVHNLHSCSSANWISRVILIAEVQRSESIGLFLLLRSILHAISTSRREPTAISKESAQFHYLVLDPSIDLDTVTSWAQQLRSRLRFSRTGGSVVLATLCNGGTSVQTVERAYDALLSGVATEIEPLFCTSTGGKSDQFGMSILFY